MGIFSSLVRSWKLMAFAILLVVPGVRAAAADQPPAVVIKSALGDLVLVLDWTRAPESCATFVRYVREGVYARTSFDDADDLAFFGGKPSQPIPGVVSNGNMNPDRAPAGEFQLPNRRGAVGFRRTVGDCNPEKRSNCTQIYVRFRDNPKSDGVFTIFAAIEGDLRLVDAIHAKLQNREPVPFSVIIPVGP